MNMAARTLRSAPPGKGHVIEIGRMEIPAWNHFRELPLPEQHYTGFDIGHICRFVANKDMSEEQISAAGRRAVEGHSSAGRSCRYMRFDGYCPSGNGRGLPLADASVSEAYLTMITGVPRLSADFVGSLLSDLARVLGPSGRLISYNGLYRLPGDILVDYGAGEIVFAEHSVERFVDEDRKSRLTAALNHHFTPLSPAFYGEFLSARGFMDREAVPGAAISILERRA